MSRKRYSNLFKGSIPAKAWFSGSFLPPSSPQTTEGSMPSFQRGEELRPGSNAPETGNDDAISNSVLPRDPEKLAITSSLHPFWHTKKGSVVIGLVILSVIGAIVGGAVGGAKASGDNRKHSHDDTFGSLSASMTTGSDPQTTSLSSTPTTTFSTTTTRIQSAIPLASSALSMPAL